MNALEKIRIVWIVIFFSLSLALLADIKNWWVATGGAEPIKSYFAKSTFTNYFDIKITSHYQKSRKNGYNCRYTVAKVGC